MPDQKYNEVSRSIKWPRLIMVIFVIWSFVALLISFRYSVYILSQGKKVFWLHIFFFNYNSAFLWVLFSPLLTLIALKIYTRFHKWYAAIPAHLFFALLLAPLHTVLFLIMDFLIQNKLNLWTVKMTFQAYFSSYFPELMIDNLIIYAIMASLLTGYLIYIKNQKAANIQMELEKKLVQSRITNLKYQLQPHFLFNSMQMVSNLIYKDVAVADKAIANLSDILRFSINQLNRDQISLKEEMDLAIKYLDFLKLRFNEKVNYSIAIPEELYPCKVPALLLQPLIENAVKHGFDKTGKPVKIDINIFYHQDKIIFDVIDDGTGFDAKITIQEEGTGIKNLVNRLDYLYPNNYNFEILDALKGSHIQIKIPYQN